MWAPLTAFSQNASMVRIKNVVKKMAPNATVSSSGGHTLVITDYNAEGNTSYIIPYKATNNTYSHDLTKQHPTEHLVKVECKAHDTSCRLKLKYADGWRGVTSIFIPFQSADDAREFIKALNDLSIGKEQ